jgi:outer membrane biosynthesis protein TonB
MTLSHLPRRLESDADLMIDTLFSEIDQTLEKNGNLDSVEETEKKHVVTQRSYFYKSHRLHLPQRNWREEHSDAVKMPAVSVGQFAAGWHHHAAFPEASDQPINPNKSPFWKRHLDKMIFFSSCSVLIGSLLLLENDHQFSLANFQDIQTAVAGSNVQGTPPVDTNAQFIRYMERALVEIDREQELAEIAKAKELTQEPIQPVAPLTPEVHPTPAATTASPQTLVTLPALPPPPPPVQNATPPAPQPSASPASTPDPNPPATPQPENQTVPSTPSPTPQEKPAPSSKTQPITPERTVPPSSPTLVGLLELGEHSAALLKVEGVTQRIMLEETIPGSNWKLVSVANQKATFTNQDQQKVMFVGEQLSVQ